MKRFAWFVCALWILVPALHGDVKPLDGEWRFQLDETDEGVSQAWFGQTLKDRIRLPGTTDEAGYGKPEVVSATKTGRLMRAAAYMGPAWYQRDIEIAPSWKGKEISLFLERVIWESRVWVDDRPAGRRDSLCTPHSYSLGQLEPGRHKLTLRIDNRQIHATGDRGHQYGDHMQTIWNGVVGRIELSADDPVSIAAQRVFARTNGEVRVECSVRNTTGSPAAGRLAVRILEKDSKRPVAALEGAFDAAGSNAVAEVTLSLAGPPRLWSEFTPDLYVAETKLRTEGTGYVDEEATTFAFREVKRDENRLLLNGRPLFLRGNIDNIHFPLTGYPAMTKAGWTRIFRLYKDYGLNNMRCHSWCPPPAAFEAADELGIYIQAEAGIWIDWWMSKANPDRPDMRTEGLPQGLGKKDRTVDEYVEAEILRLVDAYGNHPSFMFFGIGNELGNSDFAVMKTWVAAAKARDPRHLYAVSTARQITDVCDYAVTHNYPGVGWVRSQLRNHTDWDYENLYTQTKIPCIAHEIGQWPVYPEWDELAKYKGVLRPWNLEPYAEQAKKTGLYEQDRDLQQASGALSVLIYKDEIEAFLRTPSCRGLQLLGMTDYSGQGEALIGWLDSFYDSKGLVTPEAFRRYMGPVSVLARIPRYVWTNGESFTAKMLVRNNGTGDLRRAEGAWYLAGPEGKTLGMGRLSPQDVPLGTVTPMGDIGVKLEGFDKPAVLKLTLGLTGTKFSNDWKIWVYPAEVATDIPASVLLTNRLDEGTFAALRGGGRVVLMANGLGEPEFGGYAAWQPIYWSSTFLPGQSIKTLGLLVQKDHPAFAAFPTENFNDWQWWSICGGARGFVLDDLPKDYRPIAQPVSDFHEGHKLGTIFELAVGAGRLLVCGYNIGDARMKLPEVRQLRRSLLDYAASEEFSPKQSIGEAELRKLFPTVEEVRFVAGPDREKALLWVEAAAKGGKMHTDVPWAKDVDEATIAEGYGYDVECNATWKDAGGSYWHGKKLAVEVTCPPRIFGDLYVKFTDPDSDDRRGRLVFEKTKFILGSHGRRDVWAKFKAGPEETADGKLRLDATCTGGANMMIETIAFVPTP
jgi:beta-galactosidase